MKHPSPHGTAPLFALLLFLAAAFAPSASRGDSDPFEEGRRRLRQEKAEEQARIRRREEEAKRRIEQGREQGFRELEGATPSVQRCRDALLFATRTAKAWSDQRSKAVPPELMSQGQKYRARVAAIEKSYQECGFALRSPTHVMTDVLNRVSVLKLNAESAAREGDRFCFSVLGLYAGEGREGLQGVGDELKASSDSIARIRDAGVKRAIRDYKAIHKRKERQASKKLERTERERLLESESEAARRRKREYEEQQKIDEALLDADVEWLQLKNRLSELERRHSDLSQRWKQCESRLESSVSPRQYGYSSDGNAASAWNTALQSVQAELGTIETLKTDVAAFCAAVAELEANASPKAKGNAKQDEQASTEEQPETAKKPKRPTSRSTCISWSPWDEVAPLGAKTAK